MTILEEFREFLTALAEDCDCVPSACFGIDRTRATELLSRLEAELRALDDRRTVEEWAIDHGKVVYYYRRTSGGFAVVTSEYSGGENWTGETLDEAYAKAAAWVRGQGT